MKYRTVVDLGRRGKAGPISASSLADARAMVRVRTARSPRSTFVVQVFLDGAWENYE